MLADPDNELVLSAKEKISTYSKEDWKNMSAEATHLINELGKLVINNVPVKSKLAEDGFDNLIKHFDDWFFTINQIYAKKFAFTSFTQPKWIAFFDGFEPGLAKYIGRLCFYYSQKLTN